MKYLIYKLHDTTAHLIRAVDTPEEVQAIIDKANAPMLVQQIPNKYGKIIYPTIKAV